MVRYLLRSAPGHIRRSRSLYVLTVLGVALGVGAVLSIQIINGNALAAFRGSMRAVSGEVDLVVLGRLPTFPESLHVQAAGAPGVERAWAMYRTDVAVRINIDPGICFNGCQHGDHYRINCLASSGRVRNSYYV